VNGSYVYSGNRNGRPTYTENINQDVVVYWDSGKSFWAMAVILGQRGISTDVPLTSNRWLYTNESDTPDAPVNGWRGYDGALPPPRIVASVAGKGDSQGTDTETVAERAASKAKYLELAKIRKAEKAAADRAAANRQRLLDRTAAVRAAADRAAAGKAATAAAAKKAAADRAAAGKLVPEKLAAEKLAATLPRSPGASGLSTSPIRLSLMGREKGMKEALLAAYGGTATTEAAVKMGLEWLKKNQGKDGLWSLTGPYSTGSGVENRAAASAMALLAFQGAGHTHKTGEHREVVARGWAAMLRMQDADGNFFKEGSFHHRLYTQAQATIALCELYGMTRDVKYKAPAQKALDYCFRIQSPSGGWRYSPNGESDTSVTGWFVMALQSGLMAGLKVPSEKLTKISQYLDQATTDGGSQYGYRPGYGEKISMTAEGLLCRQYLGWKHDDPRLVRGANIVGENPMNWNEQDVYYWYYATQTLHHMGGEWWNKWNRVMRQTVPEHQTKIGREKGSWSPSDDAWGHQGGRLFTTCLSIYMLEVYYRHLPIYKSKLR